MKILIFLLIPFICSAQYYDTEILYKDDTFLISKQIVDSSEIIHITEFLFQGQYHMRVAKHLVKRYVQTDSSRCWHLGGKQTLYIDSSWIFFCEDSKTGLNCVTIRKDGQININN